MCIQSSSHFNPPGSGFPPRSSAETTILHQYLKRFLIKPRLHPRSSQSGETEGVSGDLVHLHLPIDFPSTRKQYRQQIVGSGRSRGVWDGHAGVKHCSSNGRLNIYGLLEVLFTMPQRHWMTPGGFPLSFPVCLLRHQVFVFLQSCVRQVSHLNP